MFRQDGITNVTHIDRGIVHLVRFKTRHFTPFILLGGAAVAVGGGGGGAGGCAISTNNGVTLLNTCCRIFSIFWIVNN